MFHVLLAALAAGMYFYANSKQIFDTTVTGNLKMNQSRAGSAELRPVGGFRDTQNNLAYFNTSVPRHRSNGISLYEAEAIQNKHEIQDELMKARKEGDAIRQTEILARWYRQKDNALKNVAQDYNKPYSMLNIRRNESITSSKRVMETIADNPKLMGISAWVPHYRSQPLEHSMTKTYWRPNQYMMPGNAAPITK